MENENLNSIDWTTRRCPDCGLRLDPFGACVMADPADVAVMTAPVGCGGTPAMAEVFLSALRAEFMKGDENHAARRN